VSYDTHRFLFWRWRSHSHQWKEEDRAHYQRVFGTSLTEMPSGTWNPVTLFLYRCSECNLVKTIELPGEWPEKEAE
jgi:hypothetical protein